jgi:hypothetical protein
VRIRYLTHWRAQPQAGRQRAAPSGTPDGADLPSGFTRTVDILNIVVVSLVAMLLLVTFVRAAKK